MKKELNSVAISGEAGSGKTTTAERLANELDWIAFGAGDAFRKYCKKNGIEDVKAASGSDEVHDGIDGEMVSLMKEGKKVVEGRVAGLLAYLEDLPGVFKVLLVCDAEERYRRIFERDPYKYKSYEEAVEKTIDREKSNREVFGRRNEANYMEEKHYDVILENTEISLKESTNVLLYLLGVAELEDEELLEFVDLRSGEARG